MKYVLDYSALSSSDMPEYVSDEQIRQAILNELGDRLLTVNHGNLIAFFHRFTQMKNIALLHGGKLEMQIDEKTGKGMLTLTSDKYDILH